jgi:hypothetical protein
VSHLAVLPEAPKAAIQAHFAKKTVGMAVFFAESIARHCANVVSVE